jgi:hypothetical protein
MLAGFHKSEFLTEASIYKQAFEKRKLKLIVFGTKWLDRNLLGVSSVYNSQQA